MPVRVRQVAYRTAVGKPTVVRLNRMGRRFRSPRTFDCLCSGSHVLSTSAGSSRQLASSRCVSPRRHFCRRISEHRARQAAYVGPCFIERRCDAVALSLPASTSDPLVSLWLDKLLHHGLLSASCATIQGFNERTRSTALLARRCFISVALGGASSGHCCNHHSPQAAGRPAVSSSAWDMCSVTALVGGAPKSEPNFGSCRPKPVTEGSQSSTMSPSSARAVV